MGEPERGRMSLSVKRQSILVLVLALGRVACEVPDSKPDASSLAAQGLFSSLWSTSFTLSLPMTGCTSSVAELNQASQAIRRVVASLPLVLSGTVVVSMPACSSSRLISGASHARTVQISYRGPRTLRVVLEGRMRLLGPCRTFKGLCTILSGLSGNACVVDRLDPSNPCGARTCNPPCQNGGTCRSDGNRCNCRPGYAGFQCQRFYGAGSFKFTIPRLAGLPAHPQRRHKQIAKLLVRASGGWPLACIVAANIGHMDAVVYNATAGDELCHPYHACPHLMDPATRVTSSASGALPKVDASIINTQSGKLAWRSDIASEYAFLNVSAGPLASNPPPDNSQYFKPGNNFQQFTKGEFYDQRLGATTSSIGILSQATLGSYQAINTHISTTRAFKTAAGSDTDEEVKRDLLADLHQSLLKQLAAKELQPTLVHLVRLDEDAGQLETEVSQGRGEACELARVQYFLAKRRGASASEINRIEEQQDCYCDYSQDTMTACRAYSDLAANATTHDYQPVSDVTEGQAAGAAARDSASAAAAGAQVTMGPEAPGAGHRRKVLAAEAPPSPRVEGLRKLVAQAQVAGSGRTLGTGRPLRYGHQASWHDPTLGDGVVGDGPRLGGSALLPPTGRGVALKGQYSSKAAWPPLGNLPGLVHQRRLQTKSVPLLKCSVDTDKEGWRNDEDAWTSLFDTNLINWVTSGLSLSFGCCVPIFFTEVLDLCLNVYVGSFNFLGFDGDLSSSGFDLESVLSLTDLVCDTQAECAKSCTAPQFISNKWVCKVDKNGAILAELSFNFVIQLEADFCFRFLDDISDETASRVIGDLLSIFGISICPAGFGFAVYPLRGADWSFYSYLQLLFFRFQLSADLAPAALTDYQDHCSSYCRCYPGYKLFKDSTYCKMCTNDIRGAVEFDITAKLLFFTWTLYSTSTSLPDTKTQTCPGPVRKLTAQLDQRRFDLSELDTLFQALQAGSPGCSSCSSTDSCIVSRSQNTTRTTCTTLDKEQVHVWLKLSVADCLSGPCANCTAQGGAAAACGGCNQCISCASGPPSGSGSYCGSDAVYADYNEWHIVQGWIEELQTGDAIENPCPCKGTESCLLTSPDLLDGQNRPLGNGVCVNLTVDQTAQMLLTRGRWPGTLEGHTLDVTCSKEGTFSLTLQSPRRQSWHGPSSFCGWLTGATAFVDGSRDPEVQVGLPCGPGSGPPGSNTSTPAQLCPPIEGLVCAWDNTCSFAPRHRWTAWGCQPDYTTSPDGCITTAFDKSTGQPLQTMDCSIWHIYQLYASYQAVPPPAWRSDSNCSSLQASEFLEAKTPDGAYTFRLVLQGNGMLVVYWIPLRDFFGEYTEDDLLPEASSLRPSLGRTVVWSYPDPKSSQFRTSAYFQRGPYSLKLTADGLYMYSADGTSSFIWALPWSSYNIGPFNKAYPVSIKGTGMYDYGGYFSVCGRPVGGTAERCYQWIQLTTNPRGSRP